MSQAATPRDVLHPAGRRVTQEIAKAFAIYWMRHLGYHDARLVRGDGLHPACISSSEAVALVETAGKPVGQAAIGALISVAARRSRQPLCFSLSDYTREARALADGKAVALFVIDLAGGIRGVEGLARLLLSNARDRHLRHCLEAMARSLDRRQRGRAARQG